MTEKETRHDDDDDHRADEVHELARQFTRLSTQNSVLGPNPFTELDGDKHPELDPSSPKFNMRTWIQNLVHLSQRDPDAHHPRTAGVSFRNLFVHGFGTPTDFQKVAWPPAACYMAYSSRKDVFNVAISAFGDLKGKFGFKKNVRKIQILRDFEGLVHSGELLVVLGRPGRSVTRRSAVPGPLTPAAAAARRSSRRSPARRTASTSRRAPTSSTRASRPR